jgi:L,D-transpeptidase ErfK/SrfK
MSRIDLALCAAAVLAIGAAAPAAAAQFTLPAGARAVGAVETYVAGASDNLLDLARRYDLGYTQLIAANPGIDPWQPGAGRAIVIPGSYLLPGGPHRGIVVNLAEQRLFYFPPGGHTVETFPIGTAVQGLDSPLGTTRVVAKLSHPTWYPPASIRAERPDLPPAIPPGPDDPLGAHALALGWPSYLIHGTNKPAGVGLRSSHGCIRLYPEDIAQLYDMVPVGTQVRVVNQPFVFGWHEGQLYVQPYDVLEDDTRNWKTGKHSRLTKAISTSQQKQLKTHDEQVNWDLVTALSQEPRGVPVPVSQDGASLDQVLAAASTVQNRVPDGSTWDGKSDLPMDEGTFRQMMSEVDPKTGEAPAAAPAVTTPAPQPAGADPATATPAAPATATPTSTGAPPTSATPVAKPRSAGPAVMSTAGSLSKATE